MHLHPFQSLAARRIGELVPPTPSEVKEKRAHGKELSEVRTIETLLKTSFLTFRKPRDQNRQQGGKNNGQVKTF